MPLFRYVNNVRVADSQLYPTPPVKNKDGLYTPTLRLKLKLHRRHFTVSNEYLIDSQRNVWGNNA